MNTMKTWLDAPAVAMLATHCACCAHPLLDAKSVETGIGPDCRRKHGWGTAEGPADWPAVEQILGMEISVERRDAHALANRLVHRVAVEQRGEAVGVACAAIAALGFAALARRIATRLGAVEVTREGDTLIVKTPRGLDEHGFSAFVGAMRGVRGARWDSARKARVVPVAAKHELWQGLKRGLAKGTLVIGDRGKMKAV